MNFIKTNWKQLATIAASAAVAVLLLTNKITHAQAVTVGVVLAGFGLHLDAIDYDGEVSK